MTFETYWPLLLILLLPYLWWVPRKTLADLSPKHLLISNLLRSAIVVVLAVALMQPVLYRSGEWMSVLYLLDISRSVSPVSIQSSLDWIQKTNQTGRPAHAQFIAFGGNSAVFDDLEQLKNVDVTGASGLRSVDQNATNIRDALEKALQSFAPHHLKRLVLITDGNENSGRMTEVIARLKEDKVRVYTIPADVRYNRDVWIESIVAPASVAADELFATEVRVYSQVDTEGQIQLRNGTKELESRKVQLKRGLNHVRFETQITKDTGPVTIEAEVRAPDDPFADNNKFREAILVQGRPKLLYVESRQESAHYLRQALELEGFTVDVVPPDDIPTSVDDFNRYEAIILSDVARTSLSDEQMESIATYVRDLGGGLIFSGGENIYGEHGYYRTPLEKILPVTFETKKDIGVALIVVFDKSGSMGGLKIELAKEAVKASALLLKDMDRFGVVAFDNEFYWPVPLQTATDRNGIIRAISTIAPGGETNMYPPLLEAYNQLAGAKTEIKHVILLSDGVSLPGEFEPLVKKMEEAKITVSTVALSVGSDRKFLAKIAEWGKGRSYFIEDERRVPQIFTQETQLATGRTLREEAFKPVLKKAVDLFKGIDFSSAPPLLGYVTTKSKDGSEILLESEEEDPILARWQYGLGKTVTFTSDMKDRWAAEWLRWNGYGKFWSQLVRETMRRYESGEFDLRVRRVKNEANMTITAIQKDGQFRNKLQPQVRIVAPDRATAVLDVSQVGPGSYEAAFPLAQKGAYLFRAVDEGTDVSSRVLPYSYPEEYRFYSPNMEPLRKMSMETTGKFQPTAEEIFDPSGENISMPTPLWPYLATLALLLYVIDVYLRRVRLFERSRI